MAATHLSIAVLSLDECDRLALETAAAQAALHAECTMCTSIEQLRAHHELGHLDLVAYWHERAPVPAEDVRHYLATLDAAPQCLLLADHVRPHDYVRARSLNADDVLECSNIPHFDLAIRRGLHYVQLRRKLHEARTRLQQSQILDRSELDTSDDGDTSTSVAEAIDRALRTDRLQLVFQPIIPVDDDAFESYEVFVRIRTEDGYLMPQEFLPTAARYGLMPAIDRWVVRNATDRFIAEQAARNRTGPALRFFLNVSAHTLVEVRAVETILKIIARARPRPGSFVIKIDKTTILSRLGVVKSLNRLVKKVGLQFAIDQYEASDSHLNYLDHVTLDYIKLHGDLVHGVDTNIDQRRDIEGIVANARGQDIGVIASQVERPTELASLYRIGVDYVQGYLIGEPSGELDPYAGGMAAPA